MYHRDSHAVYCIENKAFYTFLILIHRPYLHSPSPASETPRFAKYRYSLACHCPFIPVPVSCLSLLHLSVGLGDRFSSSGQIKPCSRLLYAISARQDQLRTQPSRALAPFRYAVEQRFQLKIRTPANTVQDVKEEKKKNLQIFQDQHFTCLACRKGTTAQRRVSSWRTTLPWDPAARSSRRSTARRKQKPQFIKKIIKVRAPLSTAALRLAFAVRLYRSALVTFCAAPLRQLGCSIYEVKPTRG